MRLGNLSTSTTLESNKSLVGYLCTLFPTLFLRALAMYAAFPRSDYYAPFDCCGALEFRLGFPVPTLHPP
jgi:hypothetical protein